MSGHSNVELTPATTVKVIVSAEGENAKKNSLRDTQGLKKRQQDGKKMSKKPTAGPPTAGPPTAGPPTAWSVPIDSEKGAANSVPGVSKDDFPPLKPISQIQDIIPSGKNASPLLTSRSLPETNISSRNGSAEIVLESILSISQRGPDRISPRKSAFPRLLSDLVSPDRVSPPRRAFPVLEVTDPLRLTERFPSDSLSRSDGLDEKHVSKNENDGPGGLFGKQSLSKSTGSIPVIKDCHAKECNRTDVTHIYQGLFCPVHQLVVKNYRVVIDKNIRDTAELIARKMEQALRKQPHPLYQKEIDTLEGSLKNKDATYINNLFSSTKLQK